MGYLWKYEGDPMPPKPNKIHKRNDSPVLQIDPETGDIVNKYKNAVEAAKAVGYSNKSICSAIHANRKTGGYYWRREK